MTAERSRASKPGRGLALASVLVGASALFTLFLWVWVQMVDARDSNLNYLFALMLGVTPFVASFIGFSAARQWGGVRSVAGRAIGALSLGLLLWSIGEFIWSYYNLIEKVEAPYPSLADLGYATGVFFWVVSAFELARLTGVPSLVRSRPSLRLIATVFVVFSVAISYFLFISIAREGYLLSGEHDIIKILLDLAYPLGDILSMTAIGLVVLVAGSYLGGVLRTPIFLALGGLFASYMYDLTFAYTTTTGTYYNAQGSDILLLAATGLMSFALISYAYTLRRVRAIHTRPGKEYE